MIQLHFRSSNKFRSIDTVNFIIRQILTKRLQIAEMECIIQTWYVFIFNKCYQWIIRFFLIKEITTSKLCYHSVTIKTPSNKTIYFWSITIEIVNNKYATNNSYYIHHISHSHSKPQISYTTEPSYVYCWWPGWMAHMHSSIFKHDQKHIQWRKLLKTERKTLQNLVLLFVQSKLCNIVWVKSVIFSIAEIPI